MMGRVRRGCVSERERERGEGELPMINKRTKIALGFRNMQQLPAFAPHSVLQKVLLCAYIIVTARCVQSR